MKKECYVIQPPSLNTVTTRNPCHYHRSNLGQTLCSQLCHLMNYLSLLILGNVYQ
jgi:hypothetical protein